MAVWVTNRPRFIEFVQTALFTAWGLKPVALWYWLKMTAAGEPVVPMDGHGRRPYETLILGQPRHAAAAAAIPVPATFALCSMPTRYHSRKPPLRGTLPLSLVFMAAC